MAKNGIGPRPWQKPYSLTPSLPQVVKFPWSKVRTYTPANSIFDVPIPSLLSLLYILIEVISRACAKVCKKALMISGLPLLFVVFPSDDAASMAVKGLSLYVWILFQSASLSLIHI